MKYTAQNSMFEGLYERVLKPEGAFREALKAAGYDMAHSKAEYPIEVWAACLEVTAKFKYPDLPRNEAWRAIGKAFLAGYFETIIGRMIAAAFPFFSARAFVQRSPRFLRSGVKEMQTDIEWLSQTKARLILHGPHEGGCFVSAGVIDESFERLKVPVKISARMLDDIDAEIVLDWS